MIFIFVTSYSSGCFLMKVFELHVNFFFFVKQACCHHLWILWMFLDFTCREIKIIHNYWSLVLKAFCNFWCVYSLPYTLNFLLQICSGFIHRAHVKNSWNLIQSVIPILIFIYYQKQHLAGTVCVCVRENGRC